jgi:hypothetical protein
MASIYRSIFKPRLKAPLVALVSISLSRDVNTGVVYNEVKGESTCTLHEIVLEVYII